MYPYVFYKDIVC